MAEIGGYDLHLYCDAEGCPNAWQGPAVYAGQTVGECRRQARAHGWKWRGTGPLHFRKTYCPDCAAHPTGRSENDGIPLRD